MASQTTPVARQPESPSRGEDVPDSVTLLELLGDEYTRRVLTAVAQCPRSGREVIEAADVSKATAYRRLRDLEEAGLVTSRTVFDPEGHHHEQFTAVVESVDVSLGSGGLDVSVDRGDQSLQSL